MKKLIYLLLFLPFFAFGQTQIPTSQINPVLPANFIFQNNGKIHGADSLYLGSPVTYVAPTSDTIVFIGTSVTTGVGAQGGGTFYYVNQLANLMRLRVNNQGVSGSTLGNPWDATNKLVSHLSRIPTKTSHTKWLILEYAPNDIAHGFSYPSTTFSTDYQTVLTYALGHGWDAAHIVMMTTVYINSTLYNSTMSSSQFQARQDSFNNVIRTLAVSNGTKIVDINKIMIGAGGTIVSWDGLHPNNTGHALIAKSIYDVINQGVLKKGESLEVNGSTESVNFIEHNFNYSNDTTNTLLGRDTLGNIKSITALPNRIRTGSLFYTGGLIYDIGATAPLALTLGANDIVMRQSAAVTGVFNGNGGYEGSIKPVDNTGSMNLITTYAGGTINLTTNGALGLVVNANHSITVGSGTPLSGVNGDVWIPNSAAGLAASVGSVYGKFTPLNASAVTSITNTHSLGVISFITSNGVNGTLQEDVHIFPTGEVAMQKGGTFTNNGTQLQTTSISTSLVAKTTTYTATAADNIITGDSTGGAFTITIPTAVGCTGRSYIVKKIDSSGNAVTVGTTSSQTIDGVTTYSLATQYKYVHLVSNGANWVIIANN